MSKKSFNEIGGYLGQLCNAELTDAQSNRLLRLLYNAGCASDDGVMVDIWDDIPERVFNACVDAAIIDKKVTVTSSALVQRINRQLAGEQVYLKKARVRTGILGYYTIDLKGNRILDSQIDIEAYGRELKVLHEYEILATEAGV